VAVASLIFGILSLLLLGALVSPFLGVYAADVLGIWPYPTGFACGVIGVVLGHLGRRIAPGSRGAALATAGLVLSYGGTLLFLALNVLIYLALATGPMRD
jgi:hypothetical protein